MRTYTRGESRDAGSDFTTAQAAGRFTERVLWPCVHAEFASSRNVKGFPLLSRATSPQAGVTPEANVNAHIVGHMKKQDEPYSFPFRSNISEWTLHGFCEDPLPAHSPFHLVGLALLGFRWFEILEFSWRSRQDFFFFFFLIKLLKKQTDQPLTSEVVVIKTLAGVLS